MDELWWAWIGWSFCGSDWSMLRPSDWIDWKAAVRAVEARLRLAIAKRLPGNNFVLFGSILAYYLAESGTLVDDLRSIAHFTNSHCPSDGVHLEKVQILNTLFTKRSSKWFCWEISISQPLNREKQESRPERETLVELLGLSWKSSFLESKNVVHRDDRKESLYPPSNRSAKRARQRLAKIGSLLIIKHIFELHCWFFCSTEFVWVFECFKTRKSLWEMANY